MSAPGPFPCKQETLSEIGDQPIFGDEVIAESAGHHVAQAEGRFPWYRAGREVLMHVRHPAACRASRSRWRARAATGVPRDRWIRP